MYKIYDDKSTEYLHECYQKLSEVYNFELRNSAIDVLIPKARTNYLKKSFRYNAGLIWNSMAVDDASEITRLPCIRNSNLDKSLTEYNLFKGR